MVGGTVVVGCVVVVGGSVVGASVVVGSVVGGAVVGAGPSSSTDAHHDRDELRLCPGTRVQRVDRDATVGHLHVDRLGAGRLARGGDEALHHPLVLDGERLRTGRRGAVADGDGHPVGAVRDVHHPASPLLRGRLHRDERVRARRRVGPRRRRRGHRDRFAGGVVAHPPVGPAAVVRLAVVRSPPAEGWRVHRSEGHPEQLPGVVGRRTPEERECAGQQRERQRDDGGTERVARSVRCAWHGGGSLCCQRPIATAMCVTGVVPSSVSSAASAWFARTFSGSPSARSPGGPGRSSRCGPDGSCRGRGS